MRSTKYTQNKITRNKTVRKIEKRERERERERERADAGNLG